MPVTNITLTPAAYALICGLVQGSDTIESDYVCASPQVWNEVRHVFPERQFHEGVEAGLVSYDEDDEGSP